MSILGVSNAAMGAYQYTGRTQKNFVGGASFTERTAQTQEVSDAEKLENFKKEIWNEPQMPSLPLLHDLPYRNNLCTHFHQYLSTSHRTSYWNRRHPPG